MKKIVVLISNIGTGTNLQAIIDGIQTGKINAKIISVISDRFGTSALEIAKKNNLPTEICSKKENLLPLLRTLSPDYICLAGWRQIILPEVIEAFPNMILNTHPGLIPDTMDGVTKNPDGTIALWNKGKMTEAAIQNFLENSATYAGCTNHFLTHEFDFGPVLGRVFEKIRKRDTVDSLYTRLKVKENKLYVDVLSKLCTNYSNNRYKTVLIVDGGGRGAALVDKYAKSKHVGKILVVPGNDLMQINTKKLVTTYQHLKTTSVFEIMEICKKEKVDLVDVAQDNAVEVGLVNELNKFGIKTFGPTKEAGQIEWDKAWARKFMVKYKIPSPCFYIFTSQKEGLDFIKKNPKKSWFVKAAGLAEGKGAIPAKNGQAAMAAIKQMHKFGKAGETYLLEEWLVGEEFSAFALSDGENFKMVGFAQDHKRVNDGDQGENTGGMGCVSNPLIVDEDIKIQVEEIFRKTVDGLRKDGRPYKGVLYLGGMVDEGKVWIIEFNARWGDPEAEVILPSITTDYLQVIEAVRLQRLKKTKIVFDKKVRLSVAGCSRGYPGDYSSVKGKEIFGLNKAMKLTGVTIYGAGIKRKNNKFYVNGGRVFHLVATGKNILEARKRAYEAMAKISIEGDNLHYRTDIGWRDVERIRRIKL